MFLAIIDLRLGKHDRARGSSRRGGSVGSRSIVMLRGLFGPVGSLVSLSIVRNDPEHGDPTGCTGPLLDVMPTDRLVNLLGNDRSVGFCVIKATRL